MTPYPKGRSFWGKIVKFFFFFKNPLIYLRAWLRQIEYIVMMTDDGYTIFFNCMTPGARVLLPGRGHIFQMVKVHYFFLGLLSTAEHRSDKLSFFLLIMTKRGNIKISGNRAEDNFNPNASCFCVLSLSVYSRTKPTAPWETAAQLRQSTGPFRQAIRIVNFIIPRVVVVQGCVHIGDCLILLKYSTIFQGIRQINWIVQRKKSWWPLMFVI